MGKYIHNGFVSDKNFDEYYSYLPKVDFDNPKQINPDDNIPLEVLEYYVTHPDDYRNKMIPLNLETANKILEILIREYGNGGGDSCQIQ